MQQIKVPFRTKWLIQAIFSLTHWLSTWTSIHVYYGLVHLQTHKWVNAESMLEKCFVGPLKRDSVVKMKPTRSGMWNVYAVPKVTFDTWSDSAESFIMTAALLFFRSQCFLDLTAGLLTKVK